MGLDSYLYLKKYESCCEWDKDVKEKRAHFYPEELKELGERIFENNFMSKETLYQVAYWRKANMIHKYFVDKCTKGVNDCREVWVPKDVLEDLVKRCREVITSPEKAEDILATQSGFFFGSTEYNEDYMRDLENTVEMLEPIIAFLKEHKEYDVVYGASW